MARWPRNWIYASVHVSTTWYGWRPQLKHVAAVYHRSRSRFDAILAPEGTRMTQPATHFKWGPLHVALVWP